MESVILGVVILAIPIMLVLGVLNEVICIYKNPFPLFRNKDKRFGMINKHITRSILKDMHYDV